MIIVLNTGERIKCIKLERFNKFCFRVIQPEASEYRLIWIGAVKEIENIEKAVQ